MKIQIEIEDCFVIGDIWLHLSLSILQVSLGANGCAYFPFVELCDKPLGAADYFGLCKNFHTLALDGVPILGLHNQTAAYRFVTLVDVMYENKARLMCTAEGTPFELFEDRLA